MRLTWLTDIHLSQPHVFPEGVKNFVRGLADVKTDAFVITGDLSDAKEISSVLKYFETYVKVPVYFVLGNHDYWRSSVAFMRKKMRALSKHVVWLGSQGHIPLTTTTALVGRDGWYDGRNGYYFASNWSTCDWDYISEFRTRPTSGWERSGGQQHLFLSTPTHDRDHVLKTMQYIADGDTVEAEIAIVQAFEKFEKVIFVTHVPPFGVASRYRGQPNSPETAPFYTNVRLGERLLDIMERFEDRKLLVLCGHTHDAFEVSIRDNLTVRVGGAAYQMPAIQDTLTLE